METNSGFKDDNSVQSHESHHLTNNRVVIGVILVLAGLFLVIRNTGFFPDFIDNVIFSWPMLLVTIGLILTLGASDKTAGIIVMAVGGFFMIPLLFRETFHMYNMFWPSIFIIIGVIFIVTRRKGWTPGKSRGMIGDDVIDYVNIFSGAERQLITENFRGGKITSIFGGGEVDLTRSSLAPGDNVIEITCIFGGTTIIVPDSWNVVIEVTPILGGFSDSRKMRGDVIRDNTRSLTIRGTVIFGGGEIKSYK